MDSLDPIILQLAIAIVTGAIGYFVGSAKSFREAKQKAYSELLAPILKIGYGYSDLRNPENEDEFSKALALLWLYGNKKVAMKMDFAVSIIIDQSRGSFTEAMQQVITEMRKDLQLLPWQSLKPEELKHLYARFR